MSERTPRQLEMREHARFYRTLNLNPLPSRGDVKRPALKEYVDWRDNGVPEWAIDKFWGENIQLPTGVRWDLVVVDLDGPEARGVWRLWCRTHGEPSTWTVERDEQASRHLWFRAPSGVDRVGTTVLWGVRSEQGGWRKGSKVELLGDGSLVIAPPSRHVKTGQPYRFVVGPDDLDRPAVLPGWLWRLASRPRLTHCVTPQPIPMRPSSPSARRHHDRKSVLEALAPDVKLLLAEQFGVRFASKNPNLNNWCPCYRDADDRSPSASFNVESGYFWAAGSDRLSLFDLGVRSGAYPDLCSAIDALGDFSGAAYGRDSA